MQKTRPPEWAEELPPNCPPSKATPPNYDTFYRLIPRFPPEKQDFFSHRKLFPTRKFKTNECRARSVSIFSELEECAKIRKLPAHRKKIIIQLTLSPESGVVLQTGRNKKHYSWWMKKGYDPIKNCKEVT